MAVSRFLSFLFIIFLVHQTPCSGNTISEYRQAMKSAGFNKFAFLSQQEEATAECNQFKENTATVTDLLPKKAKMGANGPGFIIVFLGSTSTQACVITGGIGPKTVEALALQIKNMGVKNLVADRDIPPLIDELKQIRADKFQKEKKKVPIILCNAIGYAVAELVPKPSTPPMLELGIPATTSLIGQFTGQKPEAVMLLEKMNNILVPQTNGPKTKRPMVFVKARMAPKVDNSWAHYKLKQLNTNPKVKGVVDVSGNSVILSVKAPQRGVPPQTFEAKKTALDKTFTSTKDTPNSGTALATKVKELIGGLITQAGGGLQKGQLVVLQTGQMREAALPSSARLDYQDFAAAGAYYEQDFAAEEEYENLLADFEYDTAVEEAREERELKRLRVQKEKVLRLKRMMQN